MVECGARWSSVELPPEEEHRCARHRGHWTLHRCACGALSAEHGPQTYPRPAAADAD